MNHLQWHTAQLMCHSPTDRLHVCWERCSKLKAAEMSRFEQMVEYHLNSYRQGSWNKKEFALMYGDIMSEVFKLHLCDSHLCPRVYIKRLIWSSLGLCVQGMVYLSSHLYDTSLFQATHLWAHICIQMCYSDLLCDVAWAAVGKHWRKVWQGWMSKRKHMIDVILHGCYPVPEQSTC